MTTSTVHDLSVALSLQRGITVAQISGVLDSTSSDDLLASLRRAIAAGHNRIVGDIRGVRFASSTGLRALLGAMKAARRSGGDLRLACVQDSLLPVLEMSGFTTIFRLYDDVEAAIASY